MTTKLEIAEWLEACGAKRGQLVAWEHEGLHTIPVVDVSWLQPYTTPLHLLNESLTGIQGPTFAEWQKQKGREGKVGVIVATLQLHYDCRLTGNEAEGLAHRILDAIEGE